MVERISITPGGGSEEYRTRFEIGRAKKAVMELLEEAGRDGLSGFELENTLREAGYNQKEISMAIGIEIQLGRVELIISPYYLIHTEHYDYEYIRQQLKAEYGEYAWL